MQPIRRKNVRYRTRMIPTWQSASRQSRQQSRPSPSRARRACPEGNLARSAESTIGGSAPSATASTGTAVPPVGETIQQWSALQRPPVQTKGQTRAPSAQCAGPRYRGHRSQAHLTNYGILPLGTFQACSQAVYVCLYLYAMFGHDITALLIIM